MKKSQLIDSASLYYDHPQLLELGEAIDFATTKHAGQKRASGEDYIVHPLSVAAILVDWGMDIDTVIAGILHDTIEDTDTTTAEIE